MIHKSTMVFFSEEANLCYKLQCKCLKKLFKVYQLFISFTLQKFVSLQLVHTNNTHHIKKAF